MDALRSLPEATYDGIRFPVERLDIEGGNDLVEHVAYRRPGADVEPTGRKAWRGTMAIPLINTPVLVAQYGTLFPGLRRNLIERFADRPIATLMHPTLGQMTAAIGEVSETASPDDRGGVRMTVRFVEHDASVALLSGPDVTESPVNPQQGATVAARAADKANAGVAGYQTTLPVVSAQIAYLDAAPRTFTQIASSIRLMLQPVDANLALPSLTVASAHAAYVASAALRSAIYAMRNQLIPTPQTSRVYTTPRVMADWEVAHAVYGDASLTTLIRSANAITNPLAIPAGRALTIIPTPGV